MCSNYSSWDSLLVPVTDALLGRHLVRPGMLVVHVLPLPLGAVVRVAMTRQVPVGRASRLSMRSVHHRAA
jgi:hypothetical protein